jgi:flagellar basal body rod protein FlgG
MTMPAMRLTARTLQYQQRVQDVLAHNLANASSDGFKGERISAAQLAGGGAPVAHTAMDLRQGALRLTGRPLDLALEGQGFLVVDTPDGERLVRGGGFQLDAAGQIVDASGGVLLGEKGPIVALGRDVEVEPDGVVVVDGVATDRLRVVAASADALRREGAGRFSASTTTDAPLDTRIQRGALEDGNVDPMLGMVDMLSVQRAFASNLDALKTLDAVLGVVTGDIGRP